MKFTTSQPASGQKSLASISFMGVVTGIPMEFQFGTNWSHFARVTGGVIGQPLVMEGVFSFFLESAFLGLFLYGEKRLSPKGHWWAAFLVFLWIVALWLFHHCDRRLDATSCGLSARGRRQLPGD